MLSFLPSMIKGCLSFLLYLFNTVFFCVLLLFAAALKFIVPVRAFTRQCDRFLMLLASWWMSVNAFNTRLFSKISWDIRGIGPLKKKEWYLVLSNHQSWVDILVLQHWLNNKIPMLKFFLKKELIWVPFLGPAWWALDFPFMKRYSPAVLKSKPHLKGKDLERTKKACRKFKYSPVSVMNFIEGTRFTKEKHRKQHSAYQHLLTPKAGGVAFVLGAMGEYLHKIINVTIVYPDGSPTFWQYISGQVKRVTVDFELMPVKKEMIGDYFNDPVFKEKFCHWINSLWAEKDKKIARIKEEQSITCSSP